MDYPGGMGEEKGPNPMVSVFIREAQGRWDKGEKVP